jgi:excisionase family DNA binding protein
MEKKLTVMEMSKYLGVSKEAIYNRIRRGTLETVIEGGKKYVILTDTLKREGRLPKRSNITTNLDSDYVDLLKAQVEELKIKNQKLENDKDKLLLDKERMLIESKEKIEQIYKERDEQLKTILTLANVPSLQNIASKKTEEPYIEEVEIEEDIVDKICESFEGWKTLKSYFKSKSFTKDEEKNIEKRVSKQLGKNAKIKSSQGKLYIKKDTKLKHIIGKIK